MRPTTHFAALLALLLSICACGDSSSPAPSPQTPWALTVTDASGSEARAGFDFFANLLATVSRGDDAELQIELENAPLGGDLEVKNEIGEQVVAEVFRDGESLGSSPIDSGGSWFFGLARARTAEQR